MAGFKEFFRTPFNSNIAVLFCYFRFLFYFRNFIGNFNFFGFINNCLNSSRNDDKAGISHLDSVIISIENVDKEPYTFKFNLPDTYSSVQDIVKRIVDKQSYVNKTEEKIKTTVGIEREFYIGVQRTVTVIFSGNKTPKKYNPAKSYSINNDWHINELATQINFINREHINSAAELETLIEKSGANILQQQNSLNEITEMQSSMRDVISKAEFYFSNKDKRGDAMFTTKLASAKETIEKFNISSIEDLTPLKNQYSENIKSLSKVNASMSELKKRQSAL
ncbi:MAG: hypothetical protein HDQ44_00145, partial [Desulfovibrio sp.]|nr:hypothetical protein [Desulfovibrio sp.]